MANQTKKDEVLGEIRGKMPLYANGFDNYGEIILCEKGFIIRAEGNTLRVYFHLVSMLAKATEEMVMGKVGVELEALDPLGEKHYYHFSMSEPHFNALKAACGK